MTHTNIEPAVSSRQSLILAVGDLLVLLSFVLIGRRSHALSTADFFAGLYTALPFVLCWFLVTPWLGLFKRDVASNLSRLLPRLLVGWAIAVPLAHVMRAWLLERPIPQGIPLTFVIVSLSYIGFVMLVWRVGFLWWANRRQRQHADGITEAQP